MSEQKILLFKDAGADEAVVLEVEGEVADQTLVDSNRYMSDWPSDLGVFNRDIGHGLWIWEGDLDEDTGDGEGEFRRLTPQEYLLTQNGQRVLGE